MVDTRFGCDNINVDASGHLYVACYPKPLGFLYAGWTYPHTKTGTQLVRILGPHYRQADKSALVQSTGELFSAASGAAFANGHLVATGLLDFAVLSCDWTSTA